MRILIAVLILAVADQAAFAQAGSVGGTIGKTDKSVSGDQDQPSARRERHASPSPGADSKSKSAGRKAQSRTQAGDESSAAPARSSCGNIVGTWSWPNGSVMAFYKNGGAGTAGKPPGGTWRCSGSKIIAVFNNGGRDQYVVAPDGNSLSFTTNWLPGTYTATRQQ